ncbi:MAG TPA: substrate-binding domain-containing protein [Candidatus Mediterraneibacter norfolkensis]|nr:substrate-binding domain-containing protein [Candidatus Mediterraneibacter norfolkensis]
MEKRVLLLFLTAAFAGLLLSGCKKNVGTPEDNAVVETDEEESGPEEEQESGLLFGYSSADMSDTFYETLKESIKTSLEEQGNRIMVKDAEGSVDTQITQISELIEAGVDAVFLCPADAEAIAPALEELQEADIPVINLDTRVADTAYVDAYIGSDNQNAGYVCGSDLVEQRPDGGRIVIVEKPSVSSINDRITGFEEAIYNDGFEVAARINAGMGEESLESELRELFAEDSQIDAVMCGNDPMAVQVLSVLEETEYEDILVYSVDGSPRIKTALADLSSPMQAVGAQSPINIGKKAVETAMAILDGGAYEEEIYEETFLIDRGNVGMYGTDGWQ